MRYLFYCTLAFALILAAGWGLAQNKPDPNIASSPPLTPVEEAKSHHLPPGFEIQLVASEPDIHKPINIAFDDRGRLWVTESVEYPFAAPAGSKPRDAVKILADFDDSGRARTITTFADELNIPIGVLPLDNSALVYSIPNIWRLSDPNGKGRAERRDPLFTGYGHRDTHGMTGSFTPGFDGWIYAVHGFSNTSNPRATDKSQVTMTSGNTYRFRADGSHIEQFTNGQVNPFGLSFDPLGNLYSADCHTKPAMMLLRNGCYQSFGRQHDGLGYAPEMVDRYDDSTAIAGITYYAADHFPAEFRDRLYIGDVVTHNIVQFDLDWHGSSPKTVQKYFLKSDDPWFRPVDVKLGPDGALYIADFYNRIIGHYEVALDHPGRDRERGRIWRVVYKGTGGSPAKSPGDLTKQSLSELVTLLSHPNLMVRMKAANRLAEHRGNVDAAVQAIMTPDSPAMQRSHGLWVLERRGGLSEALLAASANDEDRGVRVHTMRVLSERKQLSARLLDLLLAGLKDRDPFVQRCAADALGQHPDTKNLKPLLELRHRVAAGDTQLLHTVRMAMREQLRSPDAWRHLPEPLSQPDAGAVADVAPGVPHAAAAEFLLKQVRNYNGKEENLYRYAHHIARYGDNGDELKMVVLAKGWRNDDLDFQTTLFREIAKGSEERGQKLHSEAQAWAVELITRLFASKKPKQVQAGIELAGSLKLESVQKSLLAMIDDRRLPEANRVAALGALAAIGPKEHVALLGRLLNDAQEPIEIREQSAALLARLNQPETVAQMIQALPAAPARLQSVLAVGLAGSSGGAEKLLEAVATGKASARLLKERPVELRLADAKVPRLKERLATLTAGLPSVDQRMQELLMQRRQGFLKAKPDAELGAKVYEKSCANCHQLGGKGAKIGPQLDGIGTRGLDRLLEDILDPNRNVDQAFRSTTLNLKNGQFVNGLLLKEEGEVLVLADAQGKEVRVPKKSVDEKTQSQLSPMPANLADQIGDSDFYHLLAFLLKQRASP